MLGDDRQQILILTWRFIRTTCNVRETGQVCQNWMQYRLIKEYLKELSPGAELVVESVHPSTFRSHKFSPRVDNLKRPHVGMFDNQADFNRAEGGRSELRPNDGGRLDVHRPAGNSTRHI